MSHVTWWNGGVGPNKSTINSGTRKYKKDDEPILYGSNERGLLTPGRIEIHDTGVRQRRQASKEAKEKKIQNNAFAKAQAANPGHHFTATELLAIKGQALKQYRNKLAEEEDILNPSAFTTFAQNASCTIMGGRRVRKHTRKHTRKHRQKTRRVYL